MNPSNPTPVSDGLTDWQQKILSRIRKGYAMDAARRQWKAEEWRQMQDLVKRGIVRKTSGEKWNRAGRFVLSSPEDKDATHATFAEVSPESSIHYLLEGQQKQNLKWRAIGNENFPSENEARTEEAAYRQCFAGEMVEMGWVDFRVVRVTTTRQILPPLSSS